MRLPLFLALALVAFLTLGVFVEKRMAATAREMTKMIAEVERTLTRGKRQNALEGLRRFERRWSKTERSWALVTDHQEMDQVHLAIDRADRFLSSGGTAEARAELASLRFLVDHIPKKEALRFNSLF